MLFERRLTAAGTQAGGGLAVKTNATGATQIVGYGAVFFRENDPGSEYQLSADVVERIRPGAFDRALRDRHDVRGLFNHDSNWLLGRTASGTMRLSVDRVGLKYEISFDPVSPQHVAVLQMLKRGDLSGSSFSFHSRNDVKTRTATGFIRELTDLDLYDVGPVCFPAYSGTSAAPRGGMTDDERAAEQAWEAAFSETWQRKRRVEKIYADIVRDRLAELDRHDRQARIFSFTQ